MKCKKLIAQLLPSPNLKPPRNHTGGMPRQHNFRNPGYWDPYCVFLEATGGALILGTGRVLVDLISPSIHHFAPQSADLQVPRLRPLIPSCLVLPCFCLDWPKHAQAKAAEIFYGKDGNRFSYVLYFAIAC